MFSSITGKNLRELSLALPPLSEQEEVVGIVSAMDNVIGAAQEAVSSARELRSGLLSDLLSGDHEIPATYDRLLGAA
jgi:restriction endonuclease S subunit